MSFCARVQGPVLGCAAHSGRAPGCTADALLSQVVGAADEDAGASGGVDHGHPARASWAKASHVVA